MGGGEPAWRPGRVSNCANALDESCEVRTECPALDLATVALW